MQLVREELLKLFREENENIENDEVTAAETEVCHSVLSNQ